MKLDPEIKTNEQLLVSIESKYGQEAKEFLIQRHLYLSHEPKGRIDTDTMGWINKIIWNENNPYVSYIYVAGDLLSIDAIDYFVSVMYGALNSSRRVVPIFQYNNSVIEFKRLLKPENEKSLKESFERVFPDDPEESLDLFVKIFIYYFKGIDNYKVGFTDFPPGSQPVILVAGHSLDGFPQYTFGDKSISADKIVEKMIDMDLPKNATIKLIGCFTACKKASMSLSVKEIEKLFFQGKLLKIYDDNQTQSFFSVFVAALKARMPRFSGRVDAYIGAVGYTMREDVLTLDGTRTTAFYVQIKAKDGEVKLKRSQARISHKFSS